MYLSKGYQLSNERGKTVYFKIENSEKGRSLSFSTHITEPPNLFNLLPTMLIQHLENGEGKGVMEEKPIQTVPAIFLNPGS